MPEGKRRRVTFSEITRDAMTDAFKHPRSIDDNLVDAQQTRRIMDRLVGYTLSPLSRARCGRACRPVAFSQWLSASSSSVNVRYATSGARVLDHRTAGQSKGRDFQRRADDDRRQEGGDRRRWTAERHTAASRHEAVSTQSRRIVQAQSGAALYDLDPAAGGSRKLGFDPARTMRVAQRLYEGVDTGDGRVGLITYMRPTRPCSRASPWARRARSSAAATGSNTSCRAAGLQDQDQGRAGGSRGDRPVLPATRTPLAGVLDGEELRLYRLIWQRALASQMAPIKIQRDGRPHGRRLQPSAPPPPRRSSTASAPILHEGTEQYSQQPKAGVAGAGQGR